MKLIYDNTNKNTDATQLTFADAHYNVIHFEYVDPETNKSVYAKYTFYPFERLKF